LSGVQPRPAKGKAINRGDSSSMSEVKQIREAGKLGEPNKVSKEMVWKTHDGKTNNVTTKKAGGFLRPKSPKTGLNV